MEMEQRAAGVPAENRWPKWVYGRGSEPDPRFTFANERTFLAWIRTAVAVSALGYALRTLAEERIDVTLGRAMLAIASCACLAGWLRWARAERALRLGRRLPAPVGATLVALLLSAGLFAMAAGRS